MNIVLNIPHANPVFPSQSEKEKWADIDLLNASIRKMTDWFTDDLFMPSEELRPQITPVVFPYSRFFMDVERLIDDPMSSIGQGILYTHCNGNNRDICVEDYMPIYHEHIGQFKDLLNVDSLIIDCHSYPSDFSDTDVDICIGYNRNKSYNKTIVSLVQNHFTNYGYKVSRNTPYSNSLTPVHPIFYSSIMIEVNKRIYMNEDSITPNSNYTTLKMQINELYQKILNIKW